MKLRLKNKTLILMICILLLLNFSLFSTLAWMTDTSQVINTFTVGKVDIDLNETDVDEDGNTKENEYHLIPGQEYVKDPTMTVKAGSEESYLRIIFTVYNASVVKDIVSNSKHDLDSFIDMLGGMDMSSWKVKNVTENKADNTVSYEFRYKETVDGFAEDGRPEREKLPPLFTKLIIPGTVTMEELNDLEEGGFKMVLEGHAIQKVGFDNADEAWAAFEAEKAAEGEADAQ